MEKICGVYVITNKINGKSYVGSSTNIGKRWINHKCKSTWKKVDSDLYKDFQIYGLENFCFSVLETCEKDELKKKEALWMEKLESLSAGYNKVISYRPEEETKRRYKIWKHNYNIQHRVQHTIYMREYKKNAKKAL